jgi:dTDP-L-rhamnose 4-epimerase
MHVLVTGGAGFIGTELCAQLRNAGHDVRVLDRVASTASVDGDLRDPAAVDRALIGIDAVCHLAAKVGLGVDVQDTPDYADTNVRGTAVLLAGMARAGVRRLVLASSMVVYGEGLGRCARHGAIRPGPRLEADLRHGRFEPPCSVCGRPLAPEIVDEGARLDPRNAYAASKVAQEHFAGSWALATGASVAALRYHNVYGPGLPRNTPYAGVAAVFCSALARGEAPEVFEDGAQRRDFVHVRDVATATLAVLEAHDRGCTAVNVGSGTARTVAELATALATVAGGPDPVVTGRYRSGDVRHITADASRLRRTYGWQPEVDFGDGIKDLTAALTTS